MNKKIIYWLLGETAGRTIISAWKWLWDLPVESGKGIAQNVAQESILSMQESITQLNNAVTKLVAAYDLAKQNYYIRLGEFNLAKKHVKIAYSKGKKNTLKSAVTKVITFKKALLESRDIVVQAQANVEKSQEKLTKEIEKLESYKLEMKNIEIISTINMAMEEISQITAELDLELASSQFVSARDAIEQKALLESAKADLAKNLQQKLETEIDLSSCFTKVTEDISQNKKGTNTQADNFKSSESTGFILGLATRSPSEHLDSRPLLKRNTVIYENMYY
ncbi:MAG: PspA/IM30 family protein [Cyanobacteria bacterium P01_G01_bin.39]